MKIVSSTTMREIDCIAIDQSSIPSQDLMENAGHGIATRIISELLPKPESSQVAVFCGKGNNGGDGYVIARYLKEAGAEVVVYFLGPVDKLSTDARLNYDRADKLGLEMHEIGKIDDLPDELECDLAIDAIFGTGFSGAPRDLAGDLIEYLNDQDCLIAAVDMPSGLNADNGACEGAAVDVDCTYTLALPKFGLFLSPGREICGDVSVVPIGIPSEVVDSLNLKTSLATGALISELLPIRKPDGHKGDFGRVLTIAGATSMTGAAALSALASLRSGCGLSRLACPVSTQTVLATKLTEVMTSPMPDVRRKGVFALRSLGEFRELFKECDSVVLGPGIGRHHETMELMRRLVAGLDKPTIIDADGLNAFQNHVDILKACQGTLVLTPHAGEFARLSGSEVPSEREIEARIDAALKFAADYKVVLVLKGSPTLIASPDGRCTLNPTGNHGMATGGSGDVLSGIIGTFLAQMDDAYDAAVAAVFVHGLAGDFASDEITPRALIAGDLIDNLSEVFEALE